VGEHRTEPGGLLKHVRVDITDRRAPEALRRRPDALPKEAFPNQAEVLGHSRINWSIIPT